MIKSVTRYYLPAFRYIYKNKVFTFLNLLGLSIGLSACLLLIQYAVHEFSYDRFHLNSHRIYRVRYDNYRDGVAEFKSAAAVPAVGQAMKNNFAEVMDYAWAFPVYNGFFTTEGKTYHEKSYQMVTAGFLKLFSWEILHGDTSALTIPYSVVISKSCAQKMFGSINALGKKILDEDGKEYTVRGIIGDVPENSHIKFSMLFTPDVLYERFDSTSNELWTWYDFNTYVLLKEGTNPEKFEERFDLWLTSQLSDFWKTDNRRQFFRLQAIEGIHLYSNLSQESEPEENGNGRLVIILCLVALSILLIAWINYINLSGSMFLARAKEVGLRISFGARKRHIVALFVGEAFMMHILAAGIALVIIEFILPSFSSLIDKEHTMSLLADPVFWIIFAVLLSFGIFISGIYPILSILSYRPIDILKGTPNRFRSGFHLRQILVVLQFIVSMGFISSAFLTYSQFHFLKSQSLGIEIDKTMVIWSPGGTVKNENPDNFRNFRNKIKDLKEVSDIATSNNVPGVEIFLSEIIRRPDEKTGRIVYNLSMDENYIPTYKLEMLSGRNFNPDTDDRDKFVILNESAVKILRYSSPHHAIGKKIIRSGVELTIIGVIQDYYQKSVKQFPNPLLLSYSSENQTYISVKNNSKYKLRTISKLEESWLEFFPKKPFEFFFLEDLLERQYRNEKQIYLTLRIFSILALCIAILGLFGLSTYTSLRRTKEIGIRKVHGANASMILVMLLKDYLLLILLSIFIATPLTWFALKSWLETFPSHIRMDFNIFVIAGLTVILFALLSVAFQTIQVATLNPSRSLKYE